MGGVYGIPEVPRMAVVSVWLDTDIEGVTGDSRASCWLAKRRMKIKDICDFGMFIYVVKCLSYSRNIFC